MSCRFYIVFLVFTFFAGQLNASEPVCYILKNGQPVEDNAPGFQYNAPSFVAIGASAPKDLNPDVKPSLTEEAVEKRFIGPVDVFIRLIIDKDGKILESCSIRPSYYDLGKNAARFFLEKKKFSPALLNGEPVTSQIVIPLRFAGK